MNLRDTWLHRTAKALLPTQLYPRNIMERTVLRRTGRSVVAGPFRGMKYVETSVLSVYFPKLLGVYERELRPIVEAITALEPADRRHRRRRRILRGRSGSPESRTTVIAYEQTAEGRDLLTGMAAERRHGSSEHLWPVRTGRPAVQLGSPGRTVVICDVEGYEEKLLNPVSVPELRSSWILVELHEFVVPGITETLRKRFKPTHRITHVWQTGRGREDYPYRSWYTRLLPRAYATYLVQEFRPERTRLVLVGAACPMTAPAESLRVTVFAPLALPDTGIDRRGQAHHPHGPRAGCRTGNVRRLARRARRTRRNRRRAGPKSAGGIAGNSSSRPAPVVRVGMESCRPAAGRPLVRRGRLGLLPRGGGCPRPTRRLAVTVHDLHAFEPGLPWSETAAHRRFRVKWRAMFRQIRRFAALYLAVSEFTKRRLVELLQIDPDRIRVVGNGVEDDFFLPPSETPLPTPHVLVVGGLTERKGGDFILRVADRLADTRPNLTVTVAGANEPDLAAQVNRRTNVSLLGVVPARDLPNLVGRATALFSHHVTRGLASPP